jgi:hypothetical protein
MREGKGKFIYKNGDVLEGEWKNGNMNGQGKLTFITGESYEGEWKNGRMNGRGVYRYENGDVYEGEMKKDERNGQGKMTYKNGDVLEGEWKKDEKRGQGKMTYHNGDVYEGEMKKDKRNGQGKMTYKNGDVYEGEWKKDARHGQGTMTYSNGDVYEGNWKNDKPYNIEFTISKINYGECLKETAFEPIEGEVNVGEFINEDKGNLVFKINESFFGINKEQMRPIYENNDETVYGCFKIGTSIVPRRENVDIENPYFNLNKIGIPSGIVKHDYITKILHDNTNQLYEIVKTEHKYEASTTGQLLGRNPNAVSADHCQARSDKVIYEIQIIKEEIKEETRTRKTFKKRSRKNNSKKSKSKNKKGIFTSSSLP